MQDFKASLWEAIKEPLRLLLLAAVAVGIQYVLLLDYWWGGLFLLVLRGLDKFLHEWGKITDNTSLSRGVTRF